MTPGEVVRGPGGKACGNTLTAVAPLADKRGLGAVTIAAPPGDRTLLREALEDGPDVRSFGSRGRSAAQADTRV